MNKTNITTYKRPILSENGFEVVLINTGAKTHENPNPPNLANKEVTCIYDGCNKSTTAMWKLCPEHAPKRNQVHRHDADWLGLIRPSQEIIDRSESGDRNAKLGLKAYASAHSETTECLLDWILQEKKHRAEIIDDFIYDSLREIVGEIPDATSLQSNLESNSGYQPDELVEMIGTLVDEHLPGSSFGKEIVNDIALKIDERVDAGYSKATVMMDIPIRVLAAQYALGIACEEVNRGDLWFWKNQAKKPEKAKRGGAYMSVVYYLLRRYTDASPKQAKMISR